MAAMNAFPSTVKYDSSNIETANPPVATALKTRLEQLLRHVESDLPAFLAMAAEGAFSPPNLRMGEDTYVVEIIPKSSEGGSSSSEYGALQRCVGCPKNMGSIESTVFTAGDGDAIEHDCR